MKFEISIQTAYENKLPIEWLDTTVQDFVSKNKPRYKIGDLVGAIDFVNDNISLATIVGISIPWISDNLFYSYLCIYHRTGQYEEEREDFIEQNRAKLIRMISNKIQTLPLTHQLQKNPRNFYFQQYGKRSKQVMSFWELINLFNYLKSEES